MRFGLTNVTQKCTNSRILFPSVRYISTNNWRQAIHEKNDSVNALVYTADPVSPTPMDLPLNGLAIAIKDNICTSSMPTTCSSAMLRGSFIRSNIPYRRPTLSNRIYFTIRRDRGATTTGIRCRSRRKDEL